MRAFVRVVSHRLWNLIYEHGYYSVKISIVQLRALHCLLATVELYHFMLAIYFWSKVSQSL